MATGFLGATQDALDVHLRPEPDHVRGFGQILTGLVPGDGERTYIVHVKRDFDVKVRDVRSQIINSANIIENDLRLGDPTRLKRHHATLQRKGRTTLTESEFLELFERPRTYVLAYGTVTKLDRETVDQFRSIVARMEVVTLGGQFRQIVSASHATDLRIAWIEIVD